MIKKIVVSCLFSFLFCFDASAQTEKDSLVLKMNLRYKNQALQLNKSYFSKTDTLQITSLKFYLSNIAIYYSDETSSIEKNSFHLVDASDENSLQVRLSNTKKPISKIRFTIGIDSTSSVSGALSGDLDPTKGMYWAWQSGYINFKLEGSCNRCATRKNKFQFHIGGYLPPFYAMRIIEIPLKTIQNEIPLYIDIATFFDALNLAETNTIMIPGAKAMELSDVIIKMFSIE